MTRSSVVLLHGWAMRPAVWHALSAELGAGSEVLAPALPGHDGTTSAPAATLEAWTDHLAACLPDGATVVGWSLGAMLALDLAARHPHKVAKLVLIAATPRFVGADDWAHGLPPATVASFVSGYASAPQATLRKFLALQTLGDGARRTLLPVLDRACEPHPDDVPIAALAEGLRILADTDLRPRIAHVRQPVTLIHGANDALLPPGASHWLAATLPDARLAMFEHCGHAPFLTRAEHCARLIRGDTGD